MNRKAKSELFQQQFDRLVNTFINNKVSAGPQVVMFTSATSGAGNTTIARIFAKVLVFQSQKNVLLLDSSSQVTGRMENGLMKTTDPGQKIPKSNVPVLEKTAAYDSIAVGFNESPGYNAKAEEFTAMLAKYENKYDYLVIDGPPVLTTPDIMLWFKLVQGLYFIVEADKTRKPVIDKALKVIQKYSVPLMGFILNKRRYPISENIYRLLYK